MKDNEDRDDTMTMAPVYERRILHGCSIRALQEDGEPFRIAGYAAVFDELSEDLGGFQEKIAPGAFTKTLRNADVRALFNHDPNYVLGRTGAGTLKLKEDQRGLYMENTPPETTWANDLQLSIDRGDISQQSFGFWVIEETWTERKDKVPVRTLQEVELLDVSPVTFPAYPDTTVALRSMEYWQEAKARVPEGTDNAQMRFVRMPGANHKPTFVQTQNADEVKRKIDLHLQRQTWR